MKDFEYDVVVVGGGPSGIAAALAASRNGSHTALVEKNGCLGGGITSGYVRPFLGSVENDNIGNEIMNRILQEEAWMSPVEAAKKALADMLSESSVDVFLQNQMVGSHVSNGKITEIITSNLSDDYRFHAKVFVDATGDGNLAFRSGCEYQYGRNQDGLVQPVTIMFTIDGVDPSCTLLCEHEEDDTMLSNGTSYLTLCHNACKTGELPSTVNIVRLYSTRRPHERMVNATQLNYVNTLDSESFFKAETNLRQQIEMVVRFLRNNVPGFENVKVNGSNVHLGVRESRRIMGDYVLTSEDLLNGKSFEHAIVHHANFCIDIHNPDGAGQAIAEDKCPDKVKDYDIPYESLCPRNISNLLLAGRCISGTHEALASYRVMVICMAIGHAAGFAASLSAKSDGNIRNVDIKQIQRAVSIRN